MFDAVVLLMNFGDVSIKFHFFLSSFWVGHLKLQVVILFIYDMHWKILSLKEES